MLANASGQHVMQNNSQQGWEFSNYTLTNVQTNNIWKMRSSRTHEKQMAQGKKEKGGPERIVVLITLSLNCSADCNSTLTQRVVALHSALCPSYKEPKPHDTGGELIHYTQSVRCADTNRQSIDYAVSL
jgi:hypothetical protein